MRSTSTGKQRHKPPAPAATDWEPDRGRASHKCLPIPTLGEVFSDGDMIELVWGGRRALKPRLLMWNSGKATVAGQVVHGSRHYIPLVLDSSLLQAVRLPSHIAPYGSTQDLFSAVHDLFTPYLPQESAALLTYFTFSSWFIDRARTAPRVAIAGPPTEVTELLRLLDCVCRHPLLLGEVTAACLGALPMQVDLTLLINQPNFGPSTRSLLRASDERRHHCFRGGKLVAPFWAKAYAGTTADEGAIRVSITPKHKGRPVLTEDALHHLAIEFQTKMLAYRLATYKTVRESSFDEARLISPLREQARHLGACIVDAPELQAKLFQLLEQQDDQLRLDRSIQPEPIVVEVVLALCHEDKKRSVFVGELTTLANATLRQRGETQELSPRKVGGILRSLRLFTAARRGPGYELVLSKATRVRVHQLARDYDLATDDDGVRRCEYCTPAGHAV